MLKRKRITISSHWNKSHIEISKNIATKYGFGLELSSFVKPSWYYKKNKTVLKNHLDDYDKLLSDFKNRLSMHGPIMDIIPHTVDEEINNLVNRRVTKTMKIAEKLGIKKVVFHTGINPVVTAPNYYRNICKLQAKFWDSILDKFPKRIICLENMWEPDTKILRNILKYSKSSKLKICLDVAHANVYGKIAMKEWFKKLGNDIVHIHINDNNGKYDEHAAIGDGELNWILIVNEIGKLKTDPQVVIEIPEEPKLKKSLKYLKTNGLME